MFGSTKGFSWSTLVDNLFSAVKEPASGGGPAGDEARRGDEASSFYELNKLPVDPVPVTAGQRLIQQQEELLSVITRNNDVLAKKSSQLDRMWLAVTTHAKKTNMSVAAFEKELSTLPAVAADIAAVRKKVERSLLLLESLDEALTAMELQKEERELAHWKAFKAEELNAHKLKVTKELDNLTTRKTTLERDLLVKVGGPSI